MEFQETIWGDTTPRMVSSGKCRKCGRALKNPKSMQAGIGPICARKEKIETEGKVSEFYDKHLDVPLTEGVILRRINGEVHTNVPHLVADHSPNGYEWGYGGSGPADLALNIVENFLRHMGYKGETTNHVWDKSTIFRLSYTLHQDFKWEFIAGIDRHEGVTIPYDRIVTWVKVHMAMDELENTPDSD